MEARARRGSGSGGGIQLAFEGMLKFDVLQPIPGGRGGLGLAWEHGHEQILRGMEEEEDAGGLCWVQWKIRHWRSFSRPPPGPARDPKQSVRSSISYPSCKCMPTTGISYRR